MSTESLRIAKLIGEPFNTALPVPIEISAIADEYTAEAGEHMWRMKDVSDDVDIVFDVEPSGLIVQKKVTPLKDVLLEFKGLQSKKEYVLLEEVLDSVDTEALARRKESITRGLDKREVQLTIEAVSTPHADRYPDYQIAGGLVGNAGITVASGTDLYDAYLAAKHVLEDSGDTYVSLTGSTVKEGIDAYSKENAATDNYDVNLAGKLREWGIEIVKIFGKVAPANGVAAPLLDSKTFVMVAKNSRLTKGKPIAFCRRKINATLAAQIGADVDSAQRAIFVGEVPTLIEDGGTTQEIYGYSVLGFESIVLCVKNPSAIVVADCSSII